MALTEKQLLTRILVWITDLFVWLLLVMIASAMIAVALDASFWRMVSGVIGARFAHRSVMYWIGKKNRFED